MSGSVVIVVPGRPVSQPRPRVTRRGVYHKKNYTDYLAVVSDAAQEVFAEMHQRGEGWNAHAQHYAVRLRFWMPDRKNTDIDKLAATQLDGLTMAGAWADDRLVDKMRCERFVCKDDPRVEIEVEVMT